MLNVKDILKAAKQVAEEKGLTAEQVIEAIESALAAAYKREYGTRGEVVKALMDVKSGELKFWRVKVVVDETTVRVVEEDAAEEALPEFAHRQEEPLEEGVLPRYNPERHIMIEE